MLAWVARSHLLPQANVRRGRSSRGGCLMQFVSAGPSILCPLWLGDGESGQTLTGAALSNYPGAKRVAEGRKSRDQTSCVGRYPLLGVHTFILPFFLFFYVQATAHTVWFRIQSSTFSERLQKLRIFAMESRQRFG